MHRSLLFSLATAACALSWATQTLAHQLTIHNDSREKLYVDALTYQSKYTGASDADDLMDAEFDVNPISNFFMPFETVSDSAVMQLDINYYHSKIPAPGLAPLCIIELGDFNQATGTFQTVIENAKISLKHSCTYDATTGTISIH